MSSDPQCCTTNLRSSTTVLESQTPDECGAQEVVHLAMPRYRRDLVRRRIHENGMATSLAQQEAAMSFEMSYQVDAFHAETSSGSRITSAPRSSFSLSSRLARITSSTASRRLLRPSESVAPRGIGAGQLLNERDVALGDFAIHGRERQHGNASPRQLLRIHQSPGAWPTTASAARLDRDARQSGGANA